MITNITELMKYSYEELAHALYLKGLSDGYPKVTDKTKWREPVMAEKLDHLAHKKISAGAGSDEYGSDAFDATTNTYAEYKSNAIDEKQVRNLLQLPKGKNGNTYVPLKVSGVYNGAYKEGAIDKYEKIDHYFGIFHQEECVMIIKPNRKLLIDTLRENNSKRKPGKSTNLNTVEINLGDKSTYETAYKKESFFESYK